MTSTKLPINSLPEPEDEEDVEIKKLFSQFIKNNHAHNAPLVLKSIEVIKKGNNPEKTKILNYLNGLYHQLIAYTSQDPKEKLKLFLKAKEYFELDSKEIHQVDASIQYLYLTDPSKIKALTDQEKTQKFLEVSSLFKRAGSEIDFLHTLGMHYFYKAITLTGRPESLIFLKQAEDALKKANNSPIIHKIRAIKYLLLSQYQVDIQQSINYLKLNIREIKKTNDKYGLTESQARLYYLQGIGSNSLEEKANYFEKSGKLIVTLGKDSQSKGFSLIAEAYRLRTRNPNASIKELIENYSKAATNYKNAKKTRAYHNARGCYFGMNAIKCLSTGSKKLFIRFCIKAVKEFTKGENKDEADFFFGLVAMLHAKVLSTSQKIEALEISANLLNKKGGDLFPKYLLFKEKAAIEPDLNKLKGYKEQALISLNAFIKKIETTDSQNPRSEISNILKNKDEFLLLMKSEACQIEAQITADSIKQKEKYSEAIGYFNEIKDKYPKSKTTAHEGLGWLFIELEDYDQALKEFEECKKINPKNLQYKDNVLYAQELLQTGYRKLKEEKELKNTFIMKSFQGILGAGDPLGFTEFIPKVLNIINRRAFQFEDAPATFNKKTEPELRDELLSDLNVAFSNQATAESKVGDGKTDIRVQNPFNRYDKAIIECKWWNGEKEYIAARDQLLSYVPPRQEYAILVFFVNIKDFSNILKKAKQIDASSSSHKKQDDFNITGNKDFCFISRHEFHKGGEIEIYQLFFNLYSK